ncbi:MAG: DUF2309 domain-containing protein [Proteobacteria bacterium]|nr:DUF2309 domain-containing protein [Pseudomonadota bacterium]
MSSVRSPAGMEQHALDSAIDLACRVIAPSWPLERQIAVNPFWGLVDRRFDCVAASLRNLLGSRMSLPRLEYLRHWRSGTITSRALAQAIAEHGSTMTIDDAIACLHKPEAPSAGMRLLSDLLDEGSPQDKAPPWRDTITQQISQFCSQYFDRHQADWRRPSKPGLYADWRSGLQVDHALEPLMHAPQIRARARGLPTSAPAAIAWALARLEVPPEHVLDVLQLCLLRINGWASWCAYLGWEARLDNTRDTHLNELLAIRVSWEALLQEDRREAGAACRLWQEWRRTAALTPSSAQTTEALWQRAQEISYQDALLCQLQAPSTLGCAGHIDPASAHLVFCIDVRSERFRRSLEAVAPNVETRGFAGFFGLPIRYTPLGTSASRPQVPGLLAPRWEVTGSAGSLLEDQLIAARRKHALDVQAAWQPFFRLPSGAFSLVETIGLGYFGALLGRHFGSRPTTADSWGLSGADAHRLRPHLCDHGPNMLAQSADLVTGILRAMTLTHGFARLLVLVGHGSQSANNPQSAGLDCGACGGQTGEINARLLASMLNDVSLRAALSARGIEIPASTLAVAALHNTTTDEIRLLDTHAAPASHQADLARLRRQLTEAGHRTRLERAPLLGFPDRSQQPKSLLKRYQMRARDWAQTRPEWGLANNAGFIVAPRSRTRGMNLEGRVFLHDYMWADDPDGAVLELIMTAPMIVAHWINLQYFASTVDPEHFGSGNKVLHNVACGRIGVFEGNTGDLRIGLSRQSVHDGNKSMHTPLRLSVFIEAPRAMIEAVIAKHKTVRQLVDNGWLYLFRLDNALIERLESRNWKACVGESLDGNQSSDSTRALAQAASLPSP